MLDRLRAFVGSGGDLMGSSRAEAEKLAAAALLVEAAAIDGTVTPDERRAVSAALARHFSLAPDEVARLVADAEKAQANANHLVRFTRAIKDRFDEAGRVALMDLLWEVVHADGVVDHLESNLMRRIAGLIYVTDQDSGAARLRVAERLRGRSPSGPWGPPGGVPDGRA